jgi:hypothetical protein
VGKGAQRRAHAFIHPSVEIFGRVSCPIAGQYVLRNIAVETAERPVGERKRVEKHFTFDLEPPIARHQSFPKRFGGHGAARLCPPYARCLIQESHELCIDTFFWQEAA